MKNSLIIYLLFLASVLVGGANLYIVWPRIYEDKLTGCQYIQTVFTMTPRIDSDGEPVCNEDILK